ncbi:unnamed protein product, partial [Didymodactylos carnosus]
MKVKKSLVLVGALTLKVKEQYLSFISAFGTDRTALCSESLGPVEPLDYPAQYIVDDRFPVIDAGINVVRLETRYTCQASRTIEVTRFQHTAAFVVVRVGTNHSFMTELPDPLYIGEHETLKPMLAIFAQNDKESWDIRLPQLALAIRAAINESTGQTPAFLMYGRELKLPL